MHTTLCETPKKHSKQPAPLVGPQSLRPRFSSAQLLKRFRQLFSPDLVALWLQSSPASFYERLFTPLIVLWYLVFQCLHPDHTLGPVLADAFEGGADSLSPSGKCLSRLLKSTATTSYSDARQRLPLDLLSQALQHSGREIRSWAQNIKWQGWNVILLDGSTVRLRPWGNIAQCFPPHSHSGKERYWCLMRVVVGFCLTTGVVVGTNCAALAVSEQALAARLLPFLLPSSLIVADRNFGVFSVVQAAVAAQAAVLVRLTKVRAGKLAHSQKVSLRREMDLAIQWEPTRQDQTDPKLSRQPVAGRLLALRVQRPGFRPQTLYLFTTLQDPKTYPPNHLLDLYGRRWQVELNLRFVKTQMQLATLNCKSAEMAQKEWMAGMLAYNLIRSIMVSSAASCQISVQTLSFSRTRQFLCKWIQRHGWQQATPLAAWKRLLHFVSRCRQPRRRRTRDPEPRAIRVFRGHFPRLTGLRSAARQKLKRKS
jgi:hypothetical protein